MLRLVRSDFSTLNGLIRSLMLLVAIFMFADGIEMNVLMAVLPASSSSFAHHWMGYEEGSPTNHGRFRRGLPQRESALKAKRKRNCAGVLGVGPAREQMAGACPPWQCATALEQQLSDPSCLSSASALSFALVSLGLQHLWIA